MTKRKTASASPPVRKGPSHPRSVAVPESVPEIDSDLDQPFEEGAHDAIGPDLRHRMISEAAYHRYAERGYADGYDVDDWTSAETDIDHMLLNPEPTAGPKTSR